MKDAEHMDRFLTIHLGTARIWENTSAFEAGMASPQKHTLDSRGEFISNST